MPSVMIPNFVELRHETVISLNDVPDFLPGDTVNPSTVQRWLRKGIDGFKLESFTVGCKRYTSVEALERFLMRTNGCDPDAVPAPAPARSGMSATERAKKSRRFKLPAAGRNGQPTE